MYANKKEFLTGAHVCGIDLGRTVFHLVGLSEEGDIVVKSALASDVGPDFC